MNPNKTRLRFAPSPTGPLHMGGVRTALYSFLYARKHGGDFILRIEDTDQTRFVPGAEEYIAEALKWAGIVVDESPEAGGPHAPYRQSERKPIYGKYAMQMVESGHAYYAFDTAEELEAARKKAGMNKETFSYGPATRMEMNNSLALPESITETWLTDGMPYVIRLRVPENEKIEFTDLIRGDLSFESVLVDDKVLLKSDGMPTYHLAHIVDDVLMEITHAVRGEEWLPSAPAHILIYKYLGWHARMPQYAHLPLLLKPDGHGKLSKRDGDKLGFPVFPLEWKDPQSGEVSTGYREKGYYPEAFVNMLAFLGWNPGTEQEIFSMEDLIANFSFEHVHKAGARFDHEKAIWYNEQWLHRKPAAILAHSLKAQLQEAGLWKALYDDAFVQQCAELLQPRVQFENQMLDTGSYLFTAPTTWDDAIISKKWKPGIEKFFDAVAEIMKKTDNLDGTMAEEIFKQLAAEHNYKPGEVLQLMRVMVSGQSSGVDLFPMMALLGGAEVGKRTQLALQHISKTTNK